MPLTVKGDFKVRWPSVAADSGVFDDTQLLKDDALMLPQRGAIFLLPLPAVMRDIDARLPVDGSILI